ncbi:MAG: hypothetical protein JXP34_07750 [Planctomycetes bacterium]|nr:hypothetical protein [Planctomycetota bacterium]
MDRNRRAIGTIAIPFAERRPARRISPRARSLVAACLLALSGAPCLRARPLVIGGLGAGRSGPGALTGDFGKAMRSSLEGHVAALGFDGVEIRTDDTLTLEFLEGLDILILYNVWDPSRPIAPDVSLDEQDALLDAVEGGLAAFIMADAVFINGTFEASAQALVEPFGLTFVAGFFVEDEGDIIDRIPPHPIVDGPFGRIGRFKTKNSGWFEDLGDYDAVALATLQANGGVSLAAIDRDAISRGSGRIVLSADVNPWCGCEEAAQCYLCYNEPLFLNIIAWLSRGGGLRFIRGDADADGSLTIGDGIQILERLFADRPAFTSDCDDAGDTDDDGVFTIGDAILLFNHLFADGVPPQPPYPACGEDPTPETTLGECDWPSDECPS